MPSPWVTRALRGELPLTDAVSGRSYSALQNGAVALGADRVIIAADERTALAAADSRRSYSAPSTDPADADGTVRALRAYGIVR